MSWSAAKHADQSVRTLYYTVLEYLPKHADQSVRTGVLRSVARTISKPKRVKLLVSKEVYK